MAKPSRKGVGRLLIVKPENWSDDFIPYFHLAAGWLVTVVLLFVAMPSNFRHLAEAGLAAILITGALVAIVNCIFRAYVARTARIASIFIVLCYFSLDVLFAGIYLRLYSADHRAFSFASGIQQARAIEDFDLVMDSVHTFHAAMYQLTRLYSLGHAEVATLAHRVSAFEPPRQVALDGDTVSFSRRIDSMGDLTIVSYQLRITDQTARLLLEVDSGAGPMAALRVRAEAPGLGVQTESPVLPLLYQAGGAEAWRTETARLIAGIKVERDRMLTILRENVGGSGQWRLFDFLYLSTVTITTLGFGDVTPNNYAARAAVMAESVLGAVLLAFALVVFRRESAQASLT